LSDTKDVKLAVDKSYLVKLAKVFRKEIEGVAGINHITIHLILPSGESLCLTSSYHQVDNYVENNYGQFDHSLIGRYTDNLPFYSWEICPLNKEAEELNRIKKESYGLMSGTNFIRKLDDIKLVYSVATFIQDPVMQYVMLSKSNQILEAGDFLYNSFHDVYEEHAQISLPKVEIFQPFTGGIEGLIPNYEYMNSDRKEDERDVIKDNLVKAERKFRLIRNPQIEELVESTPEKTPICKKPKLHIVREK